MRIHNHGFLRHGQIEHVGRVATERGLIVLHQRCVAHRHQAQVLAVPYNAVALLDGHLLGGEHYLVGYYLQHQDRVAAQPIFLLQQDRVGHALRIYAAGILGAIALAEVQRVLSVGGRTLQHGQAQDIDRVATVDSLVLGRERRIADSHLAQVIALPVLLSAYVDSLLGLQLHLGIYHHRQAHDRVAAELVLLAEQHVFLRGTTIALAFIRYALARAGIERICAVGGRTRQNGQAQCVRRVATVDGLVGRYERGIALGQQA